MKNLNKLKIISTLTLLLLCLSFSQMSYAVGTYVNPIKDSFKVENESETTFMNLNQEEKLISYKELRIKEKIEALFFNLLGTLLLLAGIYLFLTYMTSTVIIFGSLMLMLISLCSFYQGGSLF